MLKNHISIDILLFLFILSTVLAPLGMIGTSEAIDVTDGTLADWDDAPVRLIDTPEWPVPPDMTNLSFVAFDYDETWLYVRWDLFDNESYKAGVLYDMGINLSASGDVWDVYVSAEIDLVGGLPVIINISIRDTNDNHIWNASDDGNMTEDGTLYFAPTPGLPPGNLSVEARFPLAHIGIPWGVIFGQFRSHSSNSVNSAVKDQVPDVGYIILTIDNLPPELNNLIDTPDPQENGGYVNITVDVTDELGLETVWVNITYPDSSWVNVSMVNGTGDEWYYNTTYDLLGIYYYTVWANDSKNWNSTGPGDFTIQDTDGPWLDNLDDAPDPQENGAYVNITVDVIDDIAVDEVWINITQPLGSWLNVSMQKGPANGWYYDAMFDDLGIHYYTIWANDTSDNWNSSTQGNFIIQDTDGPWFTNLDDTPDPQENGGYINISVDVTDDIGVDTAWINITYPSNSWINVSMDRGIGDKWYFNIPYDDLGTYSYTIWANDSLNNWNSAGPRTFTIQDTDGPFFDNLADAPDPQENDGNVNITVDITDDIGVGEAWIGITYPDDSYINLSMVKGPGNKWYFETQFGDLGIYTYMIWANDTTDNWNNTSTGNFIIIDTDGPEFDNLTVTPNPQENDHPVNISVDITDDIGLDTVLINITFPDGTSTNVTMNPGPNDKWYFTSTFNDPGTYTYTIWANDSSNNWMDTGIDTFTIQDTDGPEFHDLVDTPDPQKIDKNVNISVVVTDDIAVDTAWINITFLNGTWINTTLIRGPDDKWYYNETFTEAGNYTYTIWASDTSGNWNRTDPEYFSIKPKPPEESPDLLYLILMLTFWPLLLILFAVGLVHRYGFANRFKKDMDPLTIALADHYSAHPENPPNTHKKVQDILILSQKTGIPFEEYILATSNGSGFQVEGELQIPVDEQLRIIERSRGR